MVIYFLGASSKILSLKRNQLPIAFEEVSESRLMYTKIYKDFTWFTNTISIFNKYTAQII